MVFRLAGPFIWAARPVSCKWRKEKEHFITHFNDQHQQSIRHCVPRARIFTRYSWKLLMTFYFASILGSFIRITSTKNLNEIYYRCRWIPELFDTLSFHKEQDRNYENDHTLCIKSYFFSVFLPAAQRLSLIEVWVLLQKGTFAF